MAMVLLISVLMASCAGIAVGKYKGPNGSVGYVVGAPKSVAGMEKKLVDGEKEYQVGVLNAEADAGVKKSFGDAIRKNPGLAAKVLYPGNPNGKQIIGQYSSEGAYTSKYEYGHGSGNGQVEPARRIIKKPDYSGCGNDKACRHDRFCQANPESQKCR